jgi:autophagy-related protein 16
MRVDHVLLTSPQIALEGVSLPAYIDSSKYGTTEELLFVYRKLSETQHQLREAEKELSSMETALDDLRKRVPDTKEHEQEILGAYKKMAAAQDKAASATKQYKASLGEKEALHVQVALLKKELDESRTTARQKEESSSQMASQVATLRREMDSMHRTLLRREEEAKLLSAKSNMLAQENDTILRSKAKLEVDCATLKSTLRGREHSLAESQRQVADLQKKLESSRFRSSGNFSVPPSLATSNNPLFAASPTSNSALVTPTAPGQSGPNSIKRSVLSMIGLGPPIPTAPQTLTQHHRQSSHSSSGQLETSSSQRILLDPSSEELSSAEPYSTDNGEIFKLTDDGVYLSPTSEQGSLSPIIARASLKPGEIQRRIELESSSLSTSPSSNGHSSPPTRMSESLPPESGSHSLISPSGSMSAIPSSSSSGELIFDAAAEARLLEIQRKLDGESSSTSWAASITPKYLQLPTVVSKTVKPSSAKTKIYCAALDVSGTKLLAGGELPLTLFDAVTGKQQRLYKGVSTITFATFDEKGELVLASSTDNTARVWFPGASSPCTINHPAEVHMASFYGSDKIATIARNRSLTLWDVHSNTSYKFNNSSSQKSIAYGLHVNPISNLIYTGHLDRKIRVYDTRKLSVVSQIDTAHTDGITSLQISLDGTKIYSTSRDNSICCYDTTNNRLLATYSTPKFAIDSNWSRAALSPTGDHIAVGSVNGSIFIWETASAKLVSSLSGSKNSVLGLAWNPASYSSLISYDDQGIITMWK